MKKLSTYLLKIKYKPGQNLVIANSLLRLYLESITGMDEIEPDWAMLYLRDQDTYYKGLNPATTYLLKMDENKFAINGGNVSRILEDRRRVLYIPTAQRGNIILKYHCQLSHM